MVTSIAEQYKEKGNLHFKNHEYIDAVEQSVWKRLRMIFACDTNKRIIKDPLNPVYYRNRAMSYYKLHKYLETVQDAERALELEPESFKSLYYLGLGQTELSRLTQAENNLNKAYKLALDENSPSAAAICQGILEVRKRRCDLEEEKRIKNVAPLLSEIKEMFEDKLFQELKRAKETLSPEFYGDEKEYLEKTYAEKIQEICSLFAKADAKYEKKEVPDYLLDPISFNLFVDPVVSKSGQTFERSWILQHLKTSGTDPFSRQPLRKEELIPNIQLKAAAEDFMRKNGAF